MFSHDTSKEKAIQFSRFDDDSPFSTSSHPIELDDQYWKSPEHYVQANLARKADYAELIKNAESALKASKLGNTWFRRKRGNWKDLRRVLMTRALYTKTMMYPEVKEALLVTGDKMILETSLYDHYWGLGRDQRGTNMLGKVWQDIREKIREDEKQAREGG